jgi:methionine-S-sulfoxide reductase
MKKKTIYLAGGCFWGVQELLRKVPGVIGTEVGYAGGLTQNPSYHDVKTGTTGHAESVAVTIDLDKLSAAELFDLFFKLHDPTTKNQQGHDVGSQYRSAIFFQNEEEKQAAEESIRKNSEFWKQPITTSLEKFENFYSAEDFHQDYLQHNPGGYTCHYWR